MDNATREQRFARCYALWAAATNFRRHRTHQQDQNARRNRIKANAIKTAANTVYYGGTVGAGLGFYNLLDGRGALAIATLLVFTIFVEGLLHTLLTEITDGPLTRLQPATTPAATGSVSTVKETDQ